MAINKNFVIKNGVQVSTDLIIGDADTNKVGIGTTVPGYDLHVGVARGSRGGIGATDLVVSGVATVTNLDVTGLSTFAGALNVDGTVDFSKDVVFNGTNDITYDQSESALVFNDGAAIRVGTSSDFSISHDGSNTILRENGTGDLQIYASRIELGGASVDETMAVFTENGAAELWFNNEKKLETVAIGGTVFGDFIVAGVTTTQKLNVTGVATVGGALSLPDNTKAQFGTGGDLLIYHDSSNSYIDDQGTGDLIIRGSADIKLQSASGENYIIANDTGSVEIYYDNSKKLESTSGGLDVTGITTFSDRINVVSGVSTFQDNAKLTFGTQSDLIVYHSGSHSFIQDTTGTGNLYIDSNSLQIRNAAGDETQATFAENGAVSLFYDDYNAFQTTPQGINVSGVTTSNRLNISGVSTFTSVGSNLIPDVDGSRNIGAATSEWQNLFLDGTAHVDVLDVDETAFVTTKLTVGTGVTVQSHGVVAIAGITTVGGNLLAGGDILPDDDGARDLGSSSKEFEDLHIDGTAHIDVLDVDETAFVTTKLTVGTGVTIQNNGAVSIAGVTTANSGVRVNADSGNPDPDSATNYFSVGASEDLKIYHNGGTNYIASRDGDIQIRSDTFMLVSDDTAGRAIYLDNSNSLLELGFDGNHAVHVKATGTEFIKDVKVVNGSSVGVASIQTNGAAAFAGIVTANGGLKVGSNANTGVAASIFTNGNATFSGIVTVTDRLHVQSGISTFDDTTQSTSATTGAVVIDGGVGIAKNVNIGGNLTVTGTTTFNGGTITLGDANTDNVVFTADVDSNIIPDDDDTYDLGSSTKEWQDLFIDGTAHVDVLDVDETAFVTTKLTVGTGVTIQNNGNVAIAGITTTTDTVNIAADNKKLLVGASQDLEIFHDGSHSFISNTGTGGLILSDASSGFIYLRSNDIRLQNAAGDESGLIFSENGAVSLHFDSAETLTTTADGVEVGSGVTIQKNGNLAAAGIVTANGGLLVGSNGSAGVAATIATNGNAAFSGIVTVAGIAQHRIVLGGANSELIDDGNLSFNTSSNVLTVAGSIDLSTDIDVDGTANLDILDVDGASNFGADVVFAGAAANITFDQSTDDLIFDDDAKAIFGTGSDIEIYHSSGQSYIQNSTGNFRIDADALRLRSKTGSEAFITANVNSSVEVYYDDSKKLETTSGGVNITGITTFSDRINVVSGISTFADDAKLTFGTQADLTIFHDGTDSTISNTTNDLNITNTGDDINITSADDITIKVQGSEDAIVANGNGSVQLYHNGNLRISTTDDGADFGGTGSIRVPNGTTAQRNSSPAAGDFRYNTNTGKFEGYTDEWGDIGGSGGVDETDTSVSTTSATSCGSFAIASFRSAVIVAQITQGSNYQMGRYLVIHDGTNVTTVEESAVATGSMLGTFEGVINSSNLEFRVTMSSSSSATVTTKIDTVTV